MNEDIRLTDGFVLLRPYRPEDVYQLHKAVLESMAELSPYLDFAHDGYNLDQSKQWIADCPDRWEKGTEYNFAITDAGTGRYLGGCGLNDFDTGKRMANLGYWVRTIMTGHGVATASTLLLAKFGIDELKLKRIRLTIAVPNRASQRVAEKAGATREGQMRNGMFVRDIMYDCVVYSFIPGDFSRKEAH